MLILPLNVGSTSVNQLGRMLRHHTDLILGHEFLDGHASQGAVDVQTLGEHGGRDQLVLGRFLVQLLVRVLVEQNEVVGLLLDLRTETSRGGG